MKIIVEWSVEVLVNWAVKVIVNWAVKVLLNWAVKVPVILSQRSLEYIKIPGQDDEDMDRLTLF